LQLRFLLASLVPMLAVLATAWLIANWSFNRALEQRVAEQLQVAAAELANGRLPLSPALLQRVGALLSADVTLVDASGAPLDGVGRQGLAVAAALAGPAPPPAPGATRVQRLAVAGEPTVVVTTGIRGPADPRFSAVLIAASLREAREVARRTALGMGLAVLLAGAVLAGLSYYLVRGLAAPIERLVAMAGELAAGRRDVRVPPESAGEVGAIARALNELGERLRSYEDALAARSRSSALGEMSARIAHEIRNPLTALQLQLQLLEERVPEAQRPTVLRLLDELRRLELIVASTLAEARAARQQEQGPRLLSLVQVVSEVLDLVEPSLSHRGLVLERALREVPLLALDADRLKQALMNLLSNATDAAGPDGRVRVTTRWEAQGTSAVLEVEDDGAGIEEARRASLLSGPSGSAKPFGLGIGLKVCAEVAAEHGGRLEIGRSEDLGGARVALVLPERPAGGARG